MHDHWKRCRRRKHTHAPIMDVEHHHGHIYLLQTRESIERNEPIYKLGRTNKTVNHRFSQYPKGSKMKFHMTCRESCVDTEKTLLKLFKDRFELCERCTLYGREYFRGDSVEMIQLISTTIHDQTHVPPPPPSCEPVVDANLRPHVNIISTDPLRYKCLRCSYTTDRISNINNHKRRKTPCWKAVDKNSKSSPSEDANNTSSPSEDTRKKKFECSKCMKVLSSKQNLQNHEKFCDGLHPLQCKICLKMFASKHGKHWHKKNVKCQPASP